MRRAVLYGVGGTLLALHQYDTHFKHERFNRNIRTVTAATASEEREERERNDTSMNYDRYTFLSTVTPLLSSLVFCRSASI